MTRQGEGDKVLVGDVAGPVPGEWRAVTNVLRHRVECQGWYRHFLEAGDGKVEVRRVSGGWQVWARRAR